MNDDDENKSDEELTAQYARSTYLSSPSQLLKQDANEAQVMPPAFGDTLEISRQEISTASVLAGFEKIGAGAKFSFEDFDIGLKDT